MNLFPKFLDFILLFTNIGQKFQTIGLDDFFVKILKDQEQV